MFFNHQEVIQHVVSSYICIYYTIKTFSMISPLALSLVFKNRSHFNMVNTFLFTSTRSFYSTSSKPFLSDQRSSRNYGALRAKPAGKGKSDSFFQRVYDKSANNPLFIVNNFFKQYPNTNLAKANIDYKLINTILGKYINDFKLSEEAFDLLIKLTKYHPVKFDELPLSPPPVHPIIFLKNNMGCTGGGLTKERLISIIC